MKKWSKTAVDILVDVLMVLVLLGAASLFARAQTDQPDDPLARQVAKLTKKLQLTEAQAAEVEKILKKAGEQAAKDREAFKTVAVTLVEVAWERRETANMRIEALLNPQQKEEFKKIARMTSFDGELFDLTEGLLLDGDQAFTVEGILIEYYNTLNEMMPEEMRERMAEGGREPGIKRGRPTGMGMGMPMYGRFKGMMESLQDKKVRAIKKILTEEQKILYKQFRKHRQERMKEWMKRRRNQVN